MAEAGLRLAMLGTRGVPANYSGFETCVEQLGRRLVQRGHRVTVYCRPHHVRYDGDVYEGMRLVKLPTVPQKYLETIVHSLLSSLHALGCGYDAALYFIAGNSPVSWIPRIVGTRTILNVDGLDWKREKWPGPAKRYLQLAEALATRLPSAYLTDSRVVVRYYRERHGSTPAYIPYGSEVENAAPGPTLARLGLEPRRYLLFVGRLVPENRAHDLVEAFRGLDTDLRCAIVGDAPYAEDYKARLRDLAAGDPRIVLPGYVFGSGYRELGSNAYAFVETAGAGGTHPAVVEAMAFGNCVVVHDTPENLETVGDAGLSYDGREGAPALRRVLRELLDSPQTVERHRALARERARGTYSWESVADDYERLIYSVLRRRPPDRLVERATQD